MRLTHLHPSSGFSLLLAIICHLHSADGLKCKCTQSSAKNPCSDGICSDGAQACLMLDHPLSGRHYACSSTKGLKEGECINKASKSGASVKVCACYSSDYCNFKLWPNQHNDFDADDLDFVGSPHPREHAATTSTTNRRSSTGDTANSAIITRPWSSFKVIAISLLSSLILLASFVRQPAPLRL